MSTLLRANGCATKLITGNFHPIGVVSSCSPQNTTETVSIKDPAESLLTSHSLQNEVTSRVTAISGFSGVRAVKPISVISRRYAHTDINFPNFDSYRRDETKDLYKPAIETDDARRVLPTSVVYGVGGSIALLLTKEVVQGLVGYKAMGADQLALGSIEVNLGDVPEGKCKTYEWRGKPLFVRHRTAEEIEGVRKVKVSELRHPEADEERVIKPEWSVLIGICTHLGCVPFANQGDYQGYYCPCHGSHYDASGRVRKGPAPLNLLVPEYTFLGDEKIRVG